MSHVYLTDYTYTCEREKINLSEFILLTMANSDHLHNWDSSGTFFGPERLTFTSHGSELLPALLLHSEKIWEGQPDNEVWTTIDRVKGYCFASTLILSIFPNFRDKNTKYWLIVWCKFYARNLFLVISLVLVF